MGYALFSDVRCNSFLCKDLFAVGRFCDFDFVLVGCKSIGVDRRLWDKTIRKRYPNNCCNNGCPAEEKEVPVKASWFAKREMTGLCSEGTEILPFVLILFKQNIARLTYMIVVEE
jgi:hypothetical protein